MKWFKRARAVARRLVRSTDTDRELDAEVHSYAELLSDEKIAHGISPEQARRASRIEMGGVEQVKEEVRSARTGARFEALWQDLRYGARMLYKRPGFTTVAIITLALGIGANSAIFSVMNASLLAPVDIPAPDRVVMVWTENPARGWRELPASVPDYLDWKASGVFKSLAAFTGDGFNLRIGDKTERVDGLHTTNEWFDIQQVRPYLGRLFNPGDMKPGQNRVAVLSYSLWSSRFNRDPSMVGKTAIVDGQPFTIIGVLPKNAFRIGQETFYAPLVFDSPLAVDRGSRSHLVLGRLADGLTPAAAALRMSVVSSRLAREYRVDVGDSVRLQPAKEAYVEDIQDLALVLLCAVIFVLLVACANVANLLLARGTARRREMAVRAALGASRGRLASQLILESVLLAVVGGAAGVLPAWAGIRLIAGFELSDLPRPELVTLNGTVLAFTFALAIITGVLFGLAPAWQFWKTDTNELLKEGGRANTPSSQRRLGNVFVAGEIAVTVILLAGAGLMLRTFFHLESTDPGYDAQHVLGMRMALAGPQYDTPEQQARFCDNLLKRLQTLPAVRAVAATDLLPQSDDVHGTGIHFADRPEPKAGEVPIVLIGSITKGYFDAMRIPILRGRSFDERDRANAPLTVIIDEHAARKYWPNDNPIGKQIKLSLKEPLRTIVGVCGDVEQNLAVKLSKGRVGQIYLPYAQAPKSDVSLVISSNTDPASLSTPVRATMAAIDPDQPVFEMQTLREARAKGQAPVRVATILLGFFAALALLLASVGIYGVVSYTVGQRTREIGIRMALGASRADLLRLVLGKGGLLLVGGAVVGLLGAFALTRLMRGLLSGMSPDDPFTFAAVAFVLIVVGCLASYVPARRVSGIDPTTALRYE